MKKSNSKINKSTKKPAHSNVINKRALEKRGYVHLNDIEQLGYIKAESLPKWLLATAAAEKWQMPDPSVYDNQMDLYRRLSFIGTVVDIVAQSCTDADLNVVNEAGKENEKHDFLKLLNKPNEYDSRTEFMRAHFSHRAGNGNSYWWLNRPNENEPPDEMFIIPPSKIMAVPDEHMGLRGYAYYPGNGQTIPLEPWEIVHFKSFNPFSRYLGLSAIESLAITATGAIKAQEWNTKLFAQNNARLEGIIAFADFIDDVTWGNLKQQVKDASTKREQMMLRGVGKGGVDWKQTGISHKDMEFIQGLDMSMREVYDRLAPGLYNMLTSNSSLANGQTGESTFWAMTVSPLLHETSDKINLSIMPTYQDDMKAEFAEVVPEDKDMELREIELFSQFHTIDEVRKEKYGDEADPDPERGKLLFAQIKTSTSSVPGAPTPKAPDQYDSQTGQPIEPLPANKAMLEDLAKWQRKALKKPGSVVPFDSKEIPLDVQAEIRSALKACKSQDDVRSIFERAAGARENEVIVLARAINKLAEVNYG